MKLWLHMFGQRRCKPCEVRTNGHCPDPLVAHHGRGLQLSEPSGSASALETTSWCQAFPGVVHIQWLSEAGYKGTGILACSGTSSWRLPLPHLPSSPSSQCRSLINISHSTLSQHSSESASGEPKPWYHGKSIPWKPFYFLRGMIFDPIFESRIPIELKSSDDFQY